MLLPISQMTKPRLTEFMKFIQASAASKGRAMVETQVSWPYRLSSTWHLSGWVLSIFSEDNWATLPNLALGNLGLLAISSTDSKIKIFHQLLSSAPIRQRLEAGMPEGSNTEGSHKGNPQHLELAQLPKLQMARRPAVTAGRIPTSIIIWNFIPLALCVSNAILK